VNICAITPVVIDIDIPVDSVTKKRECLDRDYRTKGNQIIWNLCNFVIGKEINFRIFLFLSIKGKTSGNLFPLIELDDILYAVLLF